MKIKTVNIGELKVYENNAKKHPQDQVDKIARSIEKFGFNVPVIADAQLMVIAGHGRLLAARQLGLKTVPARQLVMRSIVLEFFLAPLQIRESVPRRLRQGALKRRDP